MKPDRVRPRHKHIETIYRGFGVNSRAGLMSFGCQECEPDGTALIPIGPTQIFSTGLGSFAQKQPLPSVEICLRTPLPLGWLDFWSSCRISRVKSHLNAKPYLSSGNPLGLNLSFHPNRIARESEVKEVATPVRLGERTGPSSGRLSTADLFPCGQRNDARRLLPERL